MIPVDSGSANSRLDELTRRQWRIENRLGAYAASTAASMNTRRTQGLLVTPMARGARRMVLLSRVEETVRAAGHTVELACNEYPGTVFPRGDQSLRDFTSDDNTARWVYAGDGWSLEKSLRLLPDQNTTLLSYKVLEGACALTVRPLFALRPQRDLMYQWNGRLSAEKRTKQDYRLPATCKTPEAFFTSDGAFDGKGCWYYNTIYRGTPDGEQTGLEDLWSPGEVKWTLAAGALARFACSVEPVTIASITEALKRPVATQVAVSKVAKPVAGKPLVRPKTNPDVEVPTGSGTSVPLK